MPWHVLRVASSPSAPWRGGVLVALRATFLCPWGLGARGCHILAQGTHDAADGSNSFTGCGSRSSQARLWLPGVSFLFTRQAVCSRGALA